jgi:ABC-type transport system substrate-binding protein
MEHLLKDMNYTRIIKIFIIILLFEINLQSIAYSLENNVLRIGMETEVDLKTNIDIKNICSWDIFENLFESLVKTDEWGNVKADVAERWEINKNKIIFFLKKNIIFHNGKKLTAKDVAYSLTLPFYIKEKLSSQTMLNLVKGSKTFSPESKEFLDGIKIIDEYTIEIELEKSFYQFLNLIEMPYYGITPYKKLPKRKISITEINKYPLQSSALYKIKSWSNKQVELEIFQKHRNYNKLLPNKIYIFYEKPENLKIKYIKKELDIISISDISIIQNLINSDYKYISFPPQRVNSLFFNVKKEPFNNLNFRKALFYALDRIKIQSSVIPEIFEVATQYLPPNIWGRYEVSINQLFDYKKSMQLINELSNLKKKNFDLIYTHGYFSQEILKTIVDSYKKINIHFSLVPLNSRGFFQKIAETKEYDCALISMGVAYFDPDTLYPHFHSKEQLNFGNIEDKFLDTELEKARSYIEIDKRLPIYQNILKYLNDNALVIPIGYFKRGFFVNDRIVFKKQNKIANSLNYGEIYIK